MEKEVKNKVLFVRITGEVDLKEADRLRREVDEIIENYPVKDIVFNLKNVDFIDSSGLGVILGRFKKIRSLGGRVYLASTNEKIKKILELSGFFRIMKGISREEEVWEEKAYEA
ncbi:anti-sigma F factor antagonist [Carboxydothermus hydrogenoformans]|uniref:Anti-sigma F factor antagonist n=1 Tax=Carboxydothermus hydrogenoformans (strain ATCC BAA-161 / DSM 6008 / Z-2901) TaxID=246194 RepID=Q3AAQ4_CARHZ|nr:anti-sigma F factor antagonist [Carboxydothermus hydrogenoformans]ABB14984.1 anti-sigma F factor antagonist [Carboxydothermus hydrogenoformans Z-2901]